MLFLKKAYPRTKKTLCPEPTESATCIKHNNSAHTGFFPGLQSWFAIRKSIIVIWHTEILREKNYIIPLREAKSFIFKNVLQLINTLQSRSDGELP